MPPPVRGSVTERIVRILDAFAAGDTALGVAQIARRTGLHVATTSRLIGELVELGLLVRDEDRRVRIGRRLWELGSRASTEVSLREAAMPFLEDVHAVVGNHVQLAVLEGFEVLVVERISSPNAVVSFSRIAGRLPLHASSVGQVLLANAPQEFVDGVLRRFETEPPSGFTDRTLTSAAALRPVLARVREQGYASLVGHLHPDVAGVAVPVLDARGTAVAALAVVVPADAGRPALVPLLQAAARGVARTLGG